MTTLEVKVQDKELRQYLDNLLARTSNLEPVMSGIAQELATQAEWAFRDEGPGWQALAPSTANAKVTKGKSKVRRGEHPILQVSNALARSISTRHGANFAQVGANMPYAAIHQFGGVIDRVSKKGRAYKITIPARPYLPVDSQGQLKPRAHDAILAILQNHIRKSLA